MKWKLIRTEADEITEKYPDDKKQLTEMLEKVDDSFGNLNNLFKGIGCLFC